MQGLPAPIVGAMAENASLFLAYNELQNAIRWALAKPLHEEFSLGQLAVAAAGAGAITSFFLCVSHMLPAHTSLTRAFRTPIELVKCKMQVQMLLPPPVNAATAGVAGSAVGALSPADLALKNLPGPISVLKNVVRANGLKGLWLGQTGTLIRETGGGAAWFCSKEAVARMLLSRNPTNPDGTKRSLAAWESAVSGACAGVGYNFMLFPADTVKSAVQTEAELRPRAPGEPYPSFLATFRAMYKAQGLRGLYAGCGITVARAVPSSALIFLIYDGLIRRFG